MSSHHCRKSLNNVVIQCCLSHSETNSFDEFLCYEIATFFILLICYCLQLIKVLPFILRIESSFWRRGWREKKTHTMACFASLFLIHPIAWSIRLHVVFYLKSKIKFRRCFNHSNRKTQHHLIFSLCHLVWSSFEWSRLTSLLKFNMQHTQSSNR